MNVFGTKQCCIVTKFLYSSTAFKYTFKESLLFLQNNKLIHSYYNTNTFHTWWRPVLWRALFLVRNVSGDCDVSSVMSGGVWRQQHDVSSVMSTAWCQQHDASGLMSTVWLTDWPTDPQTKFPQFHSYMQPVVAIIGGGKSILGWTIPLSTPYPYMFRNCFLFCNVTSFQVVLFLVAENKLWTNYWYEKTHNHCYFQKS